MRRVLIRFDLWPNMGQLLRRQLCVLLVATLFTSILPFSVNADESTDVTLEARNIQAGFNFDEEVIITWRNIQTTDANLLDSLHEVDYSIFRYDQPLTEAIVQSLTPIVSGIPACESIDNNAACSGKQHSTAWLPPVGTNGQFFYGIITVFSDGTTTSILTPGLSQTTSPTDEYVSEHWGPLNLSGSFDAASRTTTLTWTNPTDIGNSHQTWVWRHLEPANRQNWKQLDKSAVQVIFFGSDSSWSGVVESGIEEAAYYTVTFNNGTFTDERILGNNTLIQPIWEDTITPELVSGMSATYDSESGVTHLAWDSGIIETDMFANVWRSASPIVDTKDFGVTKIASLNGQLNSYDYVLTIGELGYFWYAVTLADQAGNEINLIESHHPTAGPIFENSVGDQNDTVVTNIVAELSEGIMVKLTWDDIPLVHNATYSVWQSQAGPIGTEELAGGNATLVGQSPSGFTGLGIPIPFGFEGDVWYAVTVEGAWGGATSTYENTLLITGLNSMQDPIWEDTLAPGAVTDLTSSYAGPSAQLQLNWSGIENAVAYQVWAIPQSSYGIGPWWNVSAQTGWTIMQTILSTDSSIGLSLYADAWDDETMLIAVVSADAYGNENSTLYGVGPVDVVVFDRTAPECMVTTTSPGETSPMPIAVGGGEIQSLGAFEIDSTHYLAVWSFETLSTLEIREEGDLEWIASIPSELQGGQTYLFEQPINSSAIGVQTWELTAIDNAGNTVTGTFRLTIVDSTPATQTPTDDISDVSELKSGLSFILMMAIIALLLFSSGEVDKEQKGANPPPPIVEMNSEEE